MPRHLYTSIFKAAAGAACFFAPWIAGNQLMLKAGNYQPNLAQLNSVLPSDLTDTKVTVGDCTIFPLFEVRNQGAHSDLRVMGFGGSQIKEWYYLVRNNYENLKNAKIVVIGANIPHRFWAPHSPYTSFLPYLMSWRDIFDYAFVEKRISDEEAIRFGLGKVFNSYLSSQAVRFMFFDRVLPNYRLWYEQRAEMIRRAEIKTQTQAELTHSLRPEIENDEYFEKIAELARQMDHRLVLMLTPRSTWTDDEVYKKEEKTWMEYCEKHQVRCFHMGRTMPDPAFGVKGVGDGIHMNDPKNMRIFWEYFLQVWQKAQKSRKVGVIIPTVSPRTAALHSDATRTNLPLAIPPNKK